MPDSGCHGKEFGFYFTCDGKPLRSSEQGNATTWFIFSKSCSHWGMKNWSHKCKSWPKETSLEATAIVQDMTATEVTAGEVVIHGTTWDMMKIELKGSALGLVIIFRFLDWISWQTAVPLVEFGRKWGSNKLAGRAEVGVRNQGSNFGHVKYEIPIRYPRTDTEYIVE